jgi:phospholipid transport system substrate-binding protein
MACTCLTRVSLNNKSEGKIVMNNLIAAMLLAVVSLTVPSAHAQTAPDVLVRSTVEEVLGVLKQNKDRRALQDIVEKKVLLHFDFRAMTQLAMGKAWREATPAQQKSLENAFRTLLVRTYTTALADTAGVDRKVEVKPAQLKPGEDYTVVRTVVKEAGRPPLAIDYRMVLVDKTWKVTDIVAENVSLVINYRGTFNSEITRSGIDGLIKVLEDKTRQGT